VIVSGPSGAGKGTLIAGMLARCPWATTTVSATTRPRRPGEDDGVHYHFIDEEEFVRRIEAGDFLEHVHYAGNRYGTLRSEVGRILAQGRAPVVEIELVGARAVRAAVPDAVAVFIAPPSVEELARRLERRGTDAPSDIEERMRTSEIELQARDEFDHVIVNDDRDRATDLLVEAVAEACRGEVVRGG
jgi:guanylate kinase